MDPSFSQKAQHPAIVVRRHVILANFDPLRVLIVHDRMLVLLPLTNPANPFVDDLISQLRIASSHVEVTSYHEGGYESEVSGPSFVEAGNYQGEITDDEYEQNRKSENKHLLPPPLHKSLPPPPPIIKEDEGSGVTFSTAMRKLQKKKKAASPPPPPQRTNDNKRRQDDHPEMLSFELRALEAVLAVATRRLAASLDELTPQAHSAYDSLKSSRMNLEHLEKLRTLKNRVSYLEARARDTSDALGTVLDEDEDMCMMRLSKLRANPHLFEPPLSSAMLTQHEDVEWLLENYLQHATAVQTGSELLRLSIDNAESSFAMKLDISRNRLIAVDTIFALFSMVFAMAAVVGGFWGMNLDQKKQSFLFVVVLTVSIGVTVATAVFFCLSRSNMLFF